MSMSILTGGNLKTMTDLEKQAYRALRKRLQQKINNDIKHGRADYERVFWRQEKIVAINKILEV